MTVAVVTASYGSYDEPATWLPQTVEHERVFVTDDAINYPMGEHLAEDPARCVVEPRPHLHPRMAAKVPKCRPDLYSDAEVLIWVDASIQPTDEHFLAYLLDHAAGPISQFAHPLRTRISDELEASAWMAKYQGQPLREQVKHYLDAGQPDGYGLWATGVIVYHRPYPELVDIGNAWLAEQARWSYQDQLSEPYVLWRSGLRPTTIPGNLFEPPHFVIRPHRRDD